MSMLIARGMARVRRFGKLGAVGDDDKIQACLADGVWVLAWEWLADRGDGDAGGKEDRLLSDIY